MLPFVALYSGGVLTRFAYDNRPRPKRERVPLQISLLGESLPGLFEMVVTLAALFGVAFQSKGPDSQFQNIGLVASAAYLAFRAGFTFSESLLKGRQPVGTPLP